MKNITLAIDEDVLAKVRRIAAEKNTTVNAIVRDHLTQLATREDQSKAAIEELFRLSDESGAEIGPITWKREDLYER